MGLLGKPTHFRVHTPYLSGGFNFLGKFSSLLGKDEPILTSIFLKKCVETTDQIFVWDTLRSK